MIYFSKFKRNVIYHYVALVDIIVNFHVSFHDQNHLVVVHL